MEAPVNRKEMLLVTAHATERSRHRREFLEIGIGLPGRIVMREQDQPAEGEQDENEKREQRFHMIARS